MHKRRRSARVVCLALSIFVMPAAVIGQESGVPSSPEAERPAESVIIVQPAIYTQPAELPQPKQIPETVPQPKQIPETTPAAYNVQATAPAPCTTGEGHSKLRRVWEFITFRQPPRPRECQGCLGAPSSRCTPPLYQYFTNRYPGVN